MDKTIKDVAEFMLERLKEDSYLCQESVVYEIEERFGESFVYLNHNFNLAIETKVLEEFRKLTSGTVVWNRVERYWRFREEFDELNIRVTDY